MSETTQSGTPQTVSPRREFLKNTARIAAASALAGVAIPHVHAAEDNTIRLALIGCGGRGSGAVANAMSAGGLVMDNRFRDEAEENTKSGGPVKLFAMADVLPERLEQTHNALHKALGDDVDVTPERRFLGLDAYKKAIDCLRPGDVAMLTTHAGFRATHFQYAVEKGVNVFMEKDFAPDPGGVQQILRTAEEADKKNLKVACGLMCRHSSARQALIQQMRDGAMGQIELIRAYRMDGGYCMGPFPRGGEKVNELMWQIHPGHPFQFLWASGGVWIELMIHQIDECFWIKDSYPVSAHGVGGRIAGSTDCSQNLDAYSVEYTFADGTKAQIIGRYTPNCYNDFATFIHGSKCAAQFSGNIHAPTSQIYKDQNIRPDNIAWKAPKEKINPWQAEWNVFLDAIRNNKPHNEAKRAALSNLGAIMGRAAVHMGKIITWEEAMASKFQFCSNVAGLTVDSPAPVQADANGRYPAPIPGVTVEI
jgi:predicted dehydrogenase